MAFDYREINPEGKLMWFGTQKVLNDFCDHYKLEDGFPYLSICVETRMWNVLHREYIFYFSKDEATFFLEL